MAFWNWRGRVVDQTLDRLRKLNQEGTPEASEQARALLEATWPSNETLAAQRAARDAARTGRCW